MSKKTQPIPNAENVSNDHDQVVEFVRMTKDGAVIFVHPNSVEPHKALGWSVIWLTVATGKVPRSVLG
jgi:aromatic ring-cleaving dioxygenase